MYNGRQNLEQWIREVESISVLNDLDAEATLRYACTLLASEICREEVEHQDDRHNLDNLFRFLQAYI
jgi:hypothetical protein